MRPEEAGKRPDLRCSLGDPVNSLDFAPNATTNPWDS
jgi:hypothetical protein